MKEFAKLMVVGVAYGIGVSIPMIATFVVKAAIDEKRLVRTMRRKSK